MPLTESPNHLVGWWLTHKSIIRTGPLAMIRHREFDGMLVTMRSSGSHWLLWLISMAMCEVYGLEPPAHLNDPRLVGLMRDPPAHNNLPRIIRTHSEMPVPLWRMLRHRMRFPKYVMLVRDIRHSLVSYYEKDPPESRPSFSEFLRGKDVFRYDHTLFRHIRFLNSWDRVRQIDPDAVTVVRYEDLQADPGAHLDRVWRFLGFPDPLSPEANRNAVARSSKDAMARHEDPRERRVVRRGPRTPPEAWFSDADRAYLNAALSRYLRNDYGYDYATWKHPPAPPSAAPDERVPETAQPAQQS